MAGMNPVIAPEVQECAFCSMAKSCCVVFSHALRNPWNDRGSRGRKQLNAPMYGASMSGCCSDWYPTHAPQPQHSR
ncbi:hypothetical protein VTK56DRAFT_2371 [Thermocarpiscus australiensis]